MSSEYPDVSIQEIAQFTQMIKTATIPNLGCVVQFYSQVLIPLSAQKEVKAYYYSKCLSQLLVVLISRVSLQPKIIEIYPEIEDALKTLYQTIDKSFFNTILQRIQDKKKDALPSQLVLKKYFQSQNMKGEILRQNWYSRDQESKKIVNANQLVNQSFGMQWVNIIDQFEHKSQDLKARREKAIFNTLNTRRNMDCLGCIEFLYQSQIINFGMTRETDIIVIPSAKTIRQFQLQIKQSIAALLNSEGGYILFACTYQKLKLVAKGEQLSEVNKESILQQLNQVFQAIVPKISFANNAQLSFMPIAIFPSQKSQYQEPEFHQGCFITRLKIWSHKTQRLFFYEHLGQLNTYCRSNKQENNLLKTHREVMRYLKKRFKINNEKNRLSEILTYTQHITQHKCKQPFVGKKISVTPSRQMANCGLFELENRYKYTSILLMKNFSQSKIKNHLIQRNITGFQFMPGGTESCNSMKILFHDTSPHKLQEILSSCTNPKDKNSKLILLIVDNAIRLKSPLQQDQFITIRNHLRQISYKSELKYCNFYNGDSLDWVLYCEFKVDIYYVFSKLREMRINGCRLVRIDPSKCEPIYTS